MSSNKGLTLEELNRQLEKFGGKGYFINHLSDFFDGNVRRTGKTKKYKRDMFHVEMSFPADEVIKDDVKGLPMKIGDFKLVPLLVFVNVEEDKNADKSDD